MKASATPATFPQPEIGRAMNGADTVVSRIEGGGHTWPGSEFLAGAGDLVGTTTFSIDANEVMWKFFQDHPRGVASSGS